MKFWTAMCLMSSLIIVIQGVMSWLFKKPRKKEAWAARRYSVAYSTYRDPRRYRRHSPGHIDWRHGNEICKNRGHPKTEKKKKPGKVPRWIDSVFFCIKLVAKAVHHGVSGLAWLFGRKTAAKKVSSKSIRHRAKLAKRKAKKGRHFRRYWGCTKEAKYNAQQAAIAANRHWATSYWRRKEREAQALANIAEAARIVEEENAYWNAMPTYEDNFSFMPGLIPKRMTPCRCHGCERINRTVVSEDLARPQRLSYAKAPASVVAPSRRTFFNAQVLLFLMGIVFGMLCVPAVAMDLGDGSKSLIGKLPLFTGKRDDFIMWLAKFTALATMGAFAAAIAQNGDGSFGE